MESTSLLIADSPVQIQQPIKRAAPDSFKSRIFICACLVLALLPMFRICYVVATTGADCITNDDILFISLTESMLGGSYDWLRYFRDTFINGHCCAAVQALLLVLGPATSWNQYTLCFVGIAMAALRAHFTTRFLCGAGSERLYWPTVAFVSWMFFSFSQISIFTTGIFSVMWQACLLFMTLGAYLLWQFPGRLYAAIASSALGILACWSLALALPSWVVYFAIATICGAHRKVGCMVAIAVGTAIAFAPYLFFTLQGSEHSRRLSEQYVHWFDTTFFVNALGRCFANDIGSKFGSLPSSEASGTAGLVSFAVFWMVVVGSVRLRKLLAPCFILCVWSMITLSMIGVVRSGIAPWYALIAAWFWSGLAAASTFVVVDCIKQGATRSRMLLAVSASCLVLPAVAAWTWQCNKSYIDKQYYLENRTPVSASILRNYDIAPEAFASYLFKLPGLSVAVTGKLLERNHWSVFSPRQVWEMQGDAIFPLAEGFCRGVDQRGCIWIRDRNVGSAGDFRSPKHLNLCVHNGSSATWRVSLPSEAKSIVLITAVALDQQIANVQPGAGWSIALKAARGQTSLLKLAGAAKKDWQQVRFNLSGYRGEDLTILFGESSADSAIVFQFPVIEIRYGPVKRP